MKAVLIAVSLMTIIATPTLAQSFDPAAGTGNIALGPTADSGESAYAQAPNNDEATNVDAAYDSTVAYCMRRFRSYDPRSATYLGYDGQRHPCP
jgi:hypothetical protein